MDVFAMVADSDRLTQGQQNGLLIFLAIVLVGVILWLFNGGGSDD